MGWGDVDSWMESFLEYANLYWEITMTSIIGSMAGQSLGNVTAVILVRTRNWGLCTRQVIKARTILEVELMLNNLLSFIDSSSGKTGRDTKIF